MADIDLKTETPDASLPATGFLFGADSQAAASPSVYTRASVTTTVVGNLSSSDSIAWNSDLLLTRKGAANLRFGAADVDGSPVAQTLSVQSTTATTTTNNVAGANLTIQGSQGTGNAAGGSIVFQVAPAGSSGTAQNALATALTIDSNSRLDTPKGIINSTLTASGAPWFILDTANTFKFQLNGGDRVFLSQSLSPFANGLVLHLAGINLQTTSGTQTAGAFLTCESANTLALRNGTNAQTFRVYNTTDGTNSEFGGIRWTSNVFEIGAQTAGTGTNRLVRFTSAVSSGSAWEFRNSATPVPVLVIAGSDRSVSLSPQVNMLVANAGGFASNLDYSSGASSTYAFQAKNGNASIIYFGLIGSAAKVMQLNDGSGRGDGYGAATEMWEMTAPAAPATNGVRIYAEDSGSGKTRLMALFATGAAQQIAIEP
jgi:hypothetical protein